MSYVDEVIEEIVQTTSGELEFHQAVKEVLDTLRPIIALKEEEYKINNKS